MKLMRMWTRLLCVVAVFVLSGGAAFAAAYQGLTPGTSTRADVERVLGAPVATVRPTLIKYNGNAAGIGSIYASYQDSGVLNRLDVYLNPPIMHGAIAATLQLGVPDASDGYGQATRDEYHSATGIILTFANLDGSAGVAAVSYATPAAVAARVAELKNGLAVGQPPADDGATGTTTTGTTTGSTTTTPTPANCADPAGSDNCTVSVGKNLDYFHVQTPEQCQTSCAGDERCVGWSFIRENGFQPGDPSMCYRMTEIGTMTQHACCITGWKANYTPGTAGSTGTSTTTTTGTTAPLPPDDSRLMLTIEEGVDRPGNDYSDFDLAAPDLGLCRQACADDAKCRAYTYVSPGIQGPKPRCWLKEAVPEATNNLCCTSGVKTQ